MALRAQTSRCVATAGPAGKQRARATGAHARPPHTRPLLHSPRAHQIILLGDSAVGKSKLVERYLMDNYHPRQRSTFALTLYRHEEDVEEAEGGEGSAAAAAAAGGGSEASAGSSSSSSSGGSGSSSSSSGSEGAASEAGAADAAGAEAAAGGRKRKRRVAVDFWDTAGQERFASMHASYYYRAHACVLVFDVTRKVTYTNLQAWYRELRQFCPHIPCICIANKIDVDYAVTTKAFAFPGKHGLPFFFVSAADGTNVVAIFQEAVRLAWAYKTRGEKDFVEEVLELIDDVSGGLRALPCHVSATLARPRARARALAPPPRTHDALQQTARACAHRSNLGRPAEGAGRLWQGAVRPPQPAKDWGGGGQGEGRVWQQQQQQRRRGRRRHCQGLRACKQNKNVSYLLYPIKTPKLAPPARPPGALAAASPCLAALRVSSGAPPWACWPLGRGSQ